MALWAFAGSVPHKTILTGLAEGIDDVARQGDVDLDEAYVVVNEVHAVTFAEVFATGLMPGSRVSRETLHEWLPVDEAPAAFLGHDDQHGIAVFDYQGDASGVFLLSDGFLLGGNVDRVTVDYAQRGFSNDELRELVRMSAAGVAIDERMTRAISDYDDAVEIGLRQVFGWAGGTAYLEIGHERRGLHCSTGELVDIPSDAQPLVAFWPDDDWERSGLERPHP